MGKYRLAYSLLLSPREMTMDRTVIAIDSILSYVTGSSDTSQGGLEEYACAHFGHV